MDKKHFKDWHIILMIIVILSIATAGMLYAQKVGNDTAKTVKVLTEDVNNLKLDTGIEKEKQQGRYELLNTKMKNLQDKVDDNNKKLDKLIDLINDKLDGAMIWTQPLKKEG